MSAMTPPRTRGSYNMRCDCGHGSDDHAQRGTGECLEDVCECRLFNRARRGVSKYRREDPRTLSSDHRRGVNISSMVTLGEAEAIHAAAAKVGCSASTWMRQVLLNEVARQR